MAVKVDMDVEEDIAWRIYCGFFSISTLLRLFSLFVFCEQKKIPDITSLPAKREEKI